MTGESGCVLAIDPGRNKCGIAVVRTADTDVKGAGTRFEVLHRSIVRREAVPDVLRQIAQQYSPGVVLVGNGTMCDEYSRLASELGLAVEIVDEKDSTRRARERYFRENPPRGWRRLIPVSLQTPPGPYDDCAAAILAERYLQALHNPESA